MKIAIIMIFHNNEAQIDKTFLIEQIKLSDSIELCLVDNDSSDKTLSLLRDIKDECSEHLSIVEIKKNTTEDSAKRAGARYMFNQFDLRHIGFVNIAELKVKRQQLNILIENLYLNKIELIDLNLKIIKRQAIKQTLFKSVFSLRDYLRLIHTNDSANQLKSVF